ncbi:MAG: sortase [Lachnospiraceae bacterium]|nr:sortase [Lachnospiraceae bacterium]
MKQKISIFCMLLGVLLLSGAIALLAYNIWDNIRAGDSADLVRQSLEEAADTQDGAADSLTGGSDMDGTEMDTVEIDGYAYIGTLTIPALNLELPVMAEWSYAGLKIAPGRYAGSVWSDDLVICGHNYTRHFGNLKFLHSGDILYFTDVNGNEFRYEVVASLILQPEDVEEMQSDESEEWDLTLFTCTIGGRKRVTVRCSRTE